MLKAIIFDMDGVIVDSEPMHATANEIALRSFGLDKPAEYYLGYAGTSKLTMMELLIKKHNLNATAMELVKAADAQNDIILDKNGFTEVEGACALIKRLYSEGLTLAIASSSPYYDIEKVLSYFDIHRYFNKIVSGFGGIINPKPAPDIYLKALEELDITPDKAIAIEDTGYGIQAAVGAGLKCVGYINPNSGKQELTQASRTIENYKTVDRAFFEDILLEA